jgi:hypothetical protein
LGENRGLYESKKLKLAEGFLKKIATSHFFEKSAVKVSEVDF